MGLDDKALTLEDLKAAIKAAQDSFGHSTRSGNCKCVFCVKDIDGIMNLTFEYELSKRAAIKKCEDMQAELTRLREVEEKYRYGVTREAWENMSRDIEEALAPEWEIAWREIINGGNSGFTMIVKEAVYLIRKERGTDELRDELVDALATIDKLRAEVAEEQRLRRIVTAANAALEARLENGS